MHRFSSNFTGSDLSAQVFFTNTGSVSGNFNSSGLSGSYFSISFSLRCSNSLRFSNSISFFDLKNGIFSSFGRFNEPVSTTGATT